MTNPTTITAEPGLPFIDIVREFNAPASAVFRAHTDPKLFAQWLGDRPGVRHVRPPNHTFNPSDMNEFQEPARRDHFGMPRAEQDPEKEVALGNEASCDRCAGVPVPGDGRQ